MNQPDPNSVAKPPSLWATFKRYRSTITFPLVVSTLIYLDWSRTQRYKAAKAAQKEPKSGNTKDTSSLE